MSKKIPAKIKKALEKGELISHKDIMSNYSCKDREEISAKTRYMKAAMELRKLRESMELTQGMLAKKMNVKREFVARAESGRQNLTLETLYRIAEATGRQLHVAFEK